MKERRIPFPEEIEAFFEAETKINEEINKIDFEQLNYLFNKLIDVQRLQSYMGLSEKKNIKYLKEIFSPLITTKECKKNTNELLKEGSLLVTHDIVDKISRPQHIEENITYELYNNKVSVQMMINTIPIIDDKGKIIEILSQVVPTFIPYYSFFESNNPNEKEQFIIILNQLPIGIVILDSDDNVIYFNWEAANLLGPKLINEEIFPLYSEEKIKLHKLLKTTNYNVYDYPVKTKMSREFVLDVKKTVFGDYKVLLLKSEHRKWEIRVDEDTEREEEFILEVFDNIGDALILFDKKINTPPKLNKHAKEWFTQKVSLTNPFGNFYSPKLFTLDEKEVEIDDLPTSKILNGYKVNDVYVFYSEDNKKRYLRAIGIPIKSGERVVKGILAFKDISDWFDKYLEIKEKREIFEKIIDFVGMAIIIGQVGRDKPLYSNKKAKELFAKYSNGEESITQLLLSFDYVTDKTFMDEQIIEADLATMILATGYCPKRMIYTISNNGEEKFIISSKVISLDCGEELNIEYNGNNNEITTGSPCFLLLIKSPSPAEENFASLVEIQDQLRFVNLELKRKRIAKLRTQKQISNLATNLNNLLSDPISLLKEYIDNLINRIEQIKEEKELPEEIIGDTLIIKNAYEELTKLFSNLFTASNAITPRLKLEKVNLKELINQILTTMMIPPEYLVLDIEDIEILTDLLKLRIAIQNLISNAVKFANPEDPKIEIIAKKEKDKIIITVRDNGPGFPEDFKNLLFHPFKKLNKEKEGTGTGLYLVRRALSTINGSISARNHEKGGAEFTITLYYQEKSDEKK